MVHTLAGRGINGMDLFGCVSFLDMPRASGVHPPQALTLFRGDKFIAWCPFLGECRWARGIFGATGYIWATALHLDPP